MASEAEDTAQGWSHNASFKLTLVNHRDYGLSVQKGGWAGGRWLGAGRLGRWASG